MPTENAFGEDFVKNSVHQINHQLQSDGFTHEMMSFTILRLALFVAHHYRTRNSHSYKTLEQALRQAKAGGFESVSKIPTENFNGTGRKNVSEEKELTKFFCGCINMCATRIQPDERSEYFDFLSLGLSLSQAKNPNIKFEDIFD